MYLPNFKIYLFFLILNKKKCSCIKKLLILCLALDPPWLLQYQPKKHTLIKRLKENRYLRAFCRKSTHFFPSHLSSMYPFHYYRIYPLLCESNLYVFQIGKWIIGSWRQGFTGWLKWYNISKTGFLGNFPVWLTEAFLETLG